MLKLHYTFSHYNVFRMNLLPKHVEEIIFNKNSSKIKSKRFPIKLAANTIKSSKKIVLLKNTKNDSKKLFD